MSDDTGERWREWARSQQVPPDRVEAAAEVAVRLGSAGANQATAAAAARITGGRGTADDVALVRERARRDDLLLAELQGLMPWGHVTAEALGDLTALWTNRRQALDSALTATAPAAAPAPAPRPPAPTLGEFLSEHGILILSYTGAFLLVVATVLYELYGVTGLTGGMRFAGVLGLDLVFGVAGWACLRSPRMRLVGHTYVAIFALIAPLVFVAAFVFLELRQHGISIELAQLLTGASLTVLYGSLALRLRSHAYGLLALTALPVAWLGGIDVAGAGPHDLRGPLFAVLVAVYVLAGAGARRVAWLGSRFAGYAALYAHGAAVLALGFTAYDDFTHLDWRGWTNTATLAIAGAGYALDRLLGGRSAMLVPAALAASLAVLAANPVLGFDVSAAAVELVVLAAAWGLAAEATRDPFLHPTLRTGLAVQALIPALFFTLPHTTAAAVMAASAALLALAAWRTASSAWLLMAGAAAGVAWYWAVRIPPSTPAHIVFGDTVFPTAAGLAALVLRAVLGRNWALPLYAVAATAAAVVAIAALGQNDLGLLGRSLLAYAALAYAAAAVERSPAALTGAVLTAAAGLIAVLADSSSPHLVYPVAIAVLALAVYTGELWWRGRSTAAWLTTHRTLGVTGMSLAAASAFLLPDDTGPHTNGALLAVAGFLVLGGLLAVDGRRHRLPILDYAAISVASLASFFLARWFGADNPQWYVAAPGLALIACGLRLPHDPRLTAAPANAQLVTALGAALLLGTTAVQAFSNEGWAYTGVLVAEGVAALVAGIGLRSRVLVVAGAAAVGGGGLRALFVLVQQGLLFVAFGTAALVLLAAGAALALLRERFQRTAGTAWRDWS